MVAPLDSQHNKIAQPAAKRTDQTTQLLQPQGVKGSIHSNLITDLKCNIITTGGGSGGSGCGRTKLGL